MIDRLSIINLRIFHMRLHTQRADASPEHFESCRARLRRLSEQRSDLQDGLDLLLAESAEGRAYFKVYWHFQDVK